MPHPRLLSLGGMGTDVRTAAGAISTESQEGLGRHLQHPANESNAEGI